MQSAAPTEGISAEAEQVSEQVTLADSYWDYAWLITNGAPYRTAWEQYQKNRDLPALVAGVAHTYATDPNYVRLAAIMRIRRGAGDWQGTPRGIAQCNSLRPRPLCVLLLWQQLADRFQFPPTFRSGFGICHLKLVERIKDKLGDNQPGILLIIGGNDLTGRVMGTRRVQASLISLDVRLPVFPLANVREAEFPVLVRIINALEESLSLFLQRKV